MALGEMFNLATGEKAPVAALTERPTLDKTGKPMYAVWGCRRTSPNGVFVVVTYAITTPWGTWSPCSKTQAEDMVRLQKMTRRV